MALVDVLVPFSSGFPEIDELTGPIPSGGVIAITGRPGVGVVDLSVSIAIANWRSVDRPCAVFTATDSLKAVTDRAVSAMAGVLPDHIRSGDLTARDLARLELWKVEQSSSHVEIIGGRDAASLIEIAEPWFATNQDALGVVDARELTDSDLAQLTAGLSETMRRTRGRIVLAVSSELGFERGIPAADFTLRLERPVLYNPETDRPSDADVQVVDRSHVNRGTAVIQIEGHYARFSPRAALNEPREPVSGEAS